VPIGVILKRNFYNRSRNRKPTHRQNLNRIGRSDSLEWVAPILILITILLLVCFVSPTRDEAGTNIFFILPFSERLYQTSFTLQTSFVDDPRQFLTRQDKIEYTSVWLNAIAALTQTPYITPVKSKLVRIT